MSIPPPTARVSATVRVKTRKGVPFYTLKLQSTPDESLKKLMKACTEHRQEWVNVLLGLGFREGLSDSSIGAKYTHGPFSVEILRTDHEDVAFMSMVRKMPSTYFVAKGERQTCKITWKAGRGDKDTLHFFRALAEPKLLPTCVGILWAGDLIEAWMKRQ